ncbi:MULTISPECIES: hypothetical protein [unclassified Pseudomonas]|uniref:hypothetical protein n=1 Tax=unclassified Pseudomonas TaxID=196821 RepID=UPI000D3C1815|nr:MULTISPECIES: hypothetical protein [unclassified Pseudomonas]RAU46591.1 hypothetical protein DBP26_010525 [Pseudomonas sp. RIT 409]RAU52396.1 hypothetical protein DBY65_017325 [Pseudomonas sp. RIT 412]
MAKHLSTSDINAIVKCIQGLEPQYLTWEVICDKAASLVGKRPTRQSICKHPAIVAAYRSAKGRDRIPEISLRKPASLQIAGQRITRLEAEVAELKQIISLYNERFLTMQYNAYAMGMKEAEILKPLPIIDRERTDKGVR